MFLQMQVAPSVRLVGLDIEVMVKEPARDWSRDSSALSHVEQDFHRWKMTGVRSDYKLELYKVLLSLVKLVDQALEVELVVAYFPSHQ